LDGKQHLSLSIGKYMDWNDIKYFSEDDFRPVGFKGGFNMGTGFLLKLDILGSQIGCPIMVHKNGGFAVSGHSRNSLHYMGLAADVNICDASGAPMDVVQQALLVYKWTFLSIGIYSCWDSLDEPGHLPGLHLDDRTAIGQPKKVWFQGPAGAKHTYPYEDFHRCIQDFILWREQWRSRLDPPGFAA
jgi:hypothetical protein